MNDPFIVKNARSKAILSELVLNSLDAIERYRVNESLRQRNGDDDYDSESSDIYTKEYLTVIKKDSLLIDSKGTVMERKFDENVQINDIFTYNDNEEIEINYDQINCNTMIVKNDNDDEENK